LIYFNYNPKSIEATWKYLLICSVGIALALLGLSSLLMLPWGINFDSLFMADLLVNAPYLSNPGSMRPLSCCWWDMAPRWAWHPCIPGSRMPMVKPQAGRGFISRRLTQMRFPGCFQNLLDLPGCRRWPLCGKVTDYHGASFHGDGGSFHYSSTEI
jgi:hypothetical protein